MKDYFKNQDEQLGSLYEDEAGQDHKYFVKVKTSHFLKLLHQHFNNLSKLNCLSIGCGTGEVEMYFSKYFKQVIGIDYSKPMIQKARNKNILNASFKVMDASKMQFENETFDIVVLFNVVHHLTSKETLVRVINEIGRVLKKDGLFFNYDMNPLNPITRKIIKTLAIDKDVNLDGFSKNKFPTTFFASEFTHLAEQHCFKKIRKETLVFFPRQLRLLSFLEPLFNKTPFGGLYALVFKKT